MKRAIMLVAFVAALGLLSFGTVTASPSKVTTRHVPTAILHDADVLLSDGQSVISGHLRTRRHHQPPGRGPDEHQWRLGREGQHRRCFPLEGDGDAAEQRRPQGHQPPDHLRGSLGHLAP
jgi:hypothetical protein